jgi:hypothetical protein
MVSQLLDVYALVTMAPMQGPLRESREEEAFNNFLVQSDLDKDNRINRINQIELSRVSRVEMSRVSRVSQSCLSRHIIVIFSNEWD